MKLSVRRMVLLSLCLILSFLSVHMPSGIRWTESGLLSRARTER